MATREPSTAPGVAPGAAPASRPPDVYLARLWDAVRRACDAVGGCRERTLDVGGRAVRLRFAGPALDEAFAPALAHLPPAPQAAPTLTVELYDHASTGVDLPPPPWRPDDQVSRGEVPVLNDGRIFTALQPGSRTLSMLNAPAGRAVFWAPDAAALPEYERAAPLRAILGWWADGTGRQLAHAAAVGTADGAVLLAGRSGSGKSTTALACLGGGLRYLGDDYVLVDAAHPATAYCLYGSAKVDPRQLVRLPWLRDCVRNPDRLAVEKALVFVGDAMPGRITRALPIRALLLPRVTGRRETTMARASGAEALAALAPSTIFQLPRAGRGTFQYLAEFVRQVPALRLELGTDLGGVVRAVEGILAGEP